MQCTEKTENWKGKTFRTHHGLGLDPDPRATQKKATQTSKISRLDEHLTQGLVIFQFGL